jgi:hypothetical protein
MTRVSGVYRLTIALSSLLMPDVLTDQLRRFFRELKRYVVACGVEHMHCRTGYLPSVEEYIRIRLGTTCVDALSALNELV